ncbi:MAG TPA: LacI family DNA-binding transcriptional regulator [Actinomycetes bacterium]
MAEQVAGPPRRPTIRDVAERAGVSKSLVSLVMRGEPLVRDDKRRRVQQAAAELGYRTNLAARSLSAVRSGTVGVLAADLRNPWSMDIVEAVGRALVEARLATLLTSAVLPSGAADQPRLDVGVIGALRDLRVDGLLVVGSVPDGARLAEVVGDLPVVVVGARAEGLARADAVRSDDAAGMELVVDHLVERGHRRIAHLGGAGGAVAAERAAGYRTAMARHGLAGEIVVQACDFSEDGGYTAAAALLDGGHPVTALAAGNDLAAVGALSAAVGALSAAADAGLDLPAGLAVTGYDDTFLAELRQISLTSVNPDSAGMGELAARRLLERIARPDRPGVEHLVAPRLVIRASSARPIPPPQEADR